MDRRPRRRLRGPAASPGRCRRGPNGRSGDSAEPGAAKNKRAERGVKVMRYIIMGYGNSPERRVKSIESTLKGSDKTRIVKILAGLRRDTTHSRFGWVKADVPRERRDA
ncbi:hypothetical protein EVAR_29605_1 [Eumeta japonica]|uniref:Uncharacterized protein n=1 Tax=Eumeta variegata TaxID=151549 RepID=A0A4C1VTB1_EUMVA|nr:hypothetical protein EVAR_29605_1 [Eumeta japonica]